MSDYLGFQNLSYMEYFNQQPSMVKGRDNAGTAYYKRMLWNKLYSVFEFDLPKGWKLNWFRYWLFHFGSIAVIYTDQFGWICQPYSIVKLDLYYNPKEIRVYNSFIKSPKVGLVGINSGIIKLLDDYYGLDDIITKYAEQLAQCDRSINVNLMNCNVTYMSAVENKKEADEMKEAYSRATSGEPFITISKDLMDGKEFKPIIPNINSTFIVDKLLDARRGIINAFLTEVGIKNANMEKRERLNSQEVEENNDETRAIVSVIYDNIKANMEEINKISGLGLNVTLRYNYTDDMEVADYE